MKKHYILTSIILLTLTSCAVLDHSYSFKSLSKKWVKEKKYSWNLMGNYHEWDRLSFSYNDDTTTYIIYPSVCYTEFLWAPVFIPFVPSVFPYFSGKDTYFNISVKAYKKFSPDDIVCIVNGKQIFPHSISIKRINKYGEKYYWNVDSMHMKNIASERPYKRPDNWGIFPQIDDIENCIFQYWYPIEQVSISDITIYLKYVKEPLYLKRKKGLRYFLELFPVPSYR
jgi:hypothetical protein